MGTHFMCTKGLACWSPLTLICWTLFLPLVQGERRVLIIECYHKEGMEGLEEWGGWMIFFMGSYFPPLLHSLPEGLAKGTPFKDSGPVCHVPSCCLPTSLPVWVTAEAQCRRRASLAHLLCVPSLQQLSPWWGGTCGCVTPDHCPLSVEHFWV